MGVRMDHRIDFGLFTKGIKGRHIPDVLNGSATLRGGYHYQEDTQDHSKKRALDFSTFNGF